MAMILTAEQQAILDGSRGETLAKVMKTLVMYGDAFEAETLVPITSEYNHLVTSFGLKVMSPVYDLMQQLLDAKGCKLPRYGCDGEFGAETAAALKRFQTANTANYEPSDAERAETLKRMAEARKKLFN